MTEEYLPLYAEKRCTVCGYWRGQHYGLSAKDSRMHCPSTFTPAEEPA